MTTPPHVKTREEWEAELADVADYAIRFIRASSVPSQTPESAKMAKELRDATISSSGSLLDAITSLQDSETKIQTENQELRAEVERLRDNFKKLSEGLEIENHDLLASGSRELCLAVGREIAKAAKIGAGFRAIEKARQPK